MTAGSDAETSPGPLGVPVENARLMHDARIRFVRPTSALRTRSNSPARTPLRN